MMPTTPNQNKKREGLEGTKLGAWLNVAKGRKLIIRMATPVTTNEVILNA